MNLKHIAALLTASLLASAVFVGCSTTTQSIAIKSEGVIVTTVDTGMKAWAIYVNARSATPSQIQNVENAYNTYYNAQLIAETAIEQLVANSGTNSAAVTQANASVATAENALLSLLNQYLTSTTK